MTRFLPVLLTLAACLAVVSAADAQTPPTTPTVSSVAVTSNPGTDGVYDTLDVITVTVTFSEAVAVTGDPMISLQIGSRKREADYAGAGAGTGELLFNYTVHPRDQDDDGIAVVEDGLEANGGAIQSADDATAATLTHTGATFAGHKVDTELILLSNMGQADGTPLRINAGERIRIGTYVWRSNVIYRPDEIALDIKTPSDTLDVTLTLEHRLISNGAHVTHTFTGSVSTAGRQTFAAPSFGFLPLYVGAPTLYISASGTGFAELGTTASRDEDDPHAYRWNIADKVYRSAGEGSFQELRSAHLPRFTISGHTTETLRILEADIVSEPYDGAAYAAGEHIEVRIILNGPVRPLATPLTVPLYLGPGAEHRRDARLVTIRGNYTDVLTPQDRRYVLYFAYTVQPGDVDTDGIVLGANLLGQAADRRIEYAMDPRVKMDLAFPAREPGASQRVDGSQTSSCDAVHCAIVTAVDAHSTESSTAGYFGLADDLVDGDDRLGNMSGRLFIYGGQEYVFMQVSVDAKVLDDGTVSSRPDFWFTQPLQSQAVDRLGIELEGRAFALEDILAFRFSGPTIEEHGFEHYEGYGWSTTGLLWRADERRLFKVVEMPVTASYDASTYATDEGDTLEVTVTLEGSFELETVTLPLVATGNAGATDADYLGVPAELVFAPGETGKQFTITIVQDDLDDDDETVTLSFGTLPDTVKTGGEHETATITIQDDDDPEITVTFEHDSYDVAEGGSATVKVTLSADPERDITIPVTTTLMGGASAADYAGVPAELAFATGETEQTFTVMATQDEVDDDDERVVLGFGKLPNRVTEDSNPKSSVNITDDDTAALVLSEMALTVDEGDAAGRTYTVKLGTEPTADVTVTVTGHADTDLTLRGLSATNTLTFTTSNWNTAQTVTVKAAQDADAADDTVTLTHTAAGAEYDDLTASLKVTVVVDDTAAIVLSAARLAVGEGDTSGESYTVKLSHVPTASVTVTVSGHAASDVSVDDTSLTFTTSNWNTAQTVTVKAAEDADAADDTVTLTHTAAGAGYDDLTASLKVTVVVDDTAAIVLSKSSLSVDEGDTTGGSYTVKLSHVPTASVTVTVSGHAASDVSVDDTSLTFTTSNWNTAQTVTVTAAHDADAAGDTVTLTHTAAGAEYAGLTASLEVTDDDDETAAIVLSKSALSVGEGDTSGESYTVKLSHVPTASVTVTVSGHAGSDISVDDTSLTFTTSNWSTAQTVTVTAAEDAAAADDTVTLTHTGTGGDYAGLTASLAVTVDDDETAAIVLSKSALSVDEGDTSGESYTVKLSHVPTASVTVTVSGHASSDVSLDKASLTFTTSNWNSAQTVTVKAAEDADAADDTVTLTHTAAGAEYDDVTAPLAVTVDDTTDIAVSFDQTSYSATEGGSSATVTVELSAPAPRQVEIPLTAAGHDGATQDDWSGVPVSLTFDVGDTSASFTVTAFDDTEEDDGEMVELGFGALPSGFVAGTPAIARVTLTNDDETVIPDCGDAIWCATVTFRTFDRGIVNASMSDSDFVYDGVLYEVGGVRAERSLQPGVTPSPPFRIPERSWFSFNFYECRTQQSRSLPEASLQTHDGSAPPHVACKLSTHNHYRDWTLFIEYDAVSVALPFDAARQLGSLFSWYGQEFYDLHAGWTQDKQYQLRIVETPGGQPSVSGPPLYLSVSTRNGNELRAQWVVPVARDDRIPQVNNYKIQWKEASGSWDSPADVSEATRGAHPRNFRIGYSISGLTRGVEYDVRVIATNQAGDSAPSNVATGMLEPEADTQTLQAQDEESPTDLVGATVPPVRLPEPKARLTASMSGVPDSHDTRNPFTFELTLSEEPATGFSYTTLRNHAFRVTGGEVTKARRLAAPGNTRWEITVRPTSDGDIVIVLAATQGCGAQGAICTADGRMLSSAIRATVSGESPPSPWCDDSQVPSGACIASQVLQEYWRSPPP